MRTVYYLVPGLSDAFYCGGLLAILRIAALSQQLVPTYVVTYRDKTDQALFLDTVLNQPDHHNSLFITSWGPDVNELSIKLSHLNHVYFAHSTGYDLQLQPKTPIICASRFTLGSLAAKYPKAPIMLQPNLLEDKFYNQHEKRNIEVLALKRKSSPYLLTLLKKLEKNHRVYILDKTIDDIAGLFNKSTVYLYDACTYWNTHQLTEGFGLQALEALACGCHVYSTMHHALADYLTPYHNCTPITGDISLDTLSIELTIKSKTKPNNSVIEHYRQNAVSESLLSNYHILNQYFDLQEKTV